MPTLPDKDACERRAANCTVGKAQAVTDNLLTRRSFATERHVEVAQERL